MLIHTHQLPYWDILKRDPSPWGESFLQIFEYGVCDKGYWTYERIVLQHEDCNEILKDINTGIDFIFLFDHTCRNDRGNKTG